MVGTVDERVELAQDLYLEGHNCTQSVVFAICDLDESERELLLHAAEGFINGMGGCTETCGAISGGIMALGLITKADLYDIDRRKETHRLARQLVKRFRQKNGATLCRELKSGKDGEPIRLCSGCIEDAVRITCDLLESRRS